MVSGKVILLAFLLLVAQSSFCWGFYGHRKINQLAVFLLPPEMVAFFKPHIDFLSEHAVDPDKRRYAVKDEAPRHYIDIDHYGEYPYADLPRKWEEAVAKYSEDSLVAHGIVPWWIPVMQRRLTAAFKDRDGRRILKLAADLGHYVADAHVPLHASSNYDGQLTGQRGIHGFWESRVPELLAEKEWDFFIGKAGYIANVEAFTWMRVLESARAADTVLAVEKQVSDRFPGDQKFAFENRHGLTTRQFSGSYTRAYNKALGGMIERRMRESVHAVASLWFTAWVNAGQPELKSLSGTKFTEDDVKEFEALNRAWRNSAAAGQNDH